MIETLGCSPLQSPEKSNDQNKIHYHGLMYNHNIFQTPIMFSVPFSRYFHIIYIEIPNTRIGVI